MLECKHKYLFNRNVKNNNKILTKTFIKINKHNCLLHGIILYNIFLAYINIT